MKRFFAIFCVITSVGCANSDSPPTTQVQTGSKSKKKTAVSKASKEVPIGQWGYKLDGKDSKGLACTTGVHNFDSLDLMCINILDPIQNNDCGYVQRIRKFFLDCEPNGYSLFESRYCRVALLNVSAVIQPFGIYETSDIVHTKTYCTGRTSKGLTIGDLNLNGWFYEDISAKIDMHFKPKYDSHFKLRMSRGGAPYISDFDASSNGSAIRTGFTADGKFQYVIKCGGTWACDALDE
jgi:hypothetical protein